MTAPIWTPPQDGRDSSNIAAFARWLGERRGLYFPDYQQLRRWSVTDLDGFWSSVQEFFEIPFRNGYDEVLAEERMPGARWFPGVLTNYADELGSLQARDEAAFVTLGEDGNVGEISGAEFRRQVAALASSLRGLGVGLGDHVAGYLPNIVEGAVAFFATASLGAIWSSVGEDYAPAAVLARLAQLAPKVLIAADGYRFGGVVRDRRAAVTEVHAALHPAHTVMISRAGLPFPAGQGFLEWGDLVQGAPELRPAAVPFDHPLWVLFSSGTTGAPKGIVHSHGGIQLEMHKTLSLHWDLGPGRRLLWATSPSWVIWNLQVSVPISGAAAVCYDGSPTFPDAAALWRFVADQRITDFGTSPGFLAATAKTGVQPGRQLDLSALRQIISTGSPLPASASYWASENVGSHIPLVSISGGTDVVGAFAGGAPTVPVWPGEISAGCLGVAIEAWDETGSPVTGRVGELVVTRPMPSMPVALWDDPAGERYRDAYFATYPGIWRHGDWITITGHGSIIVHGRSDATLNRHGIRMGSADIYQALEAVPEVTDALVIGAELDSGGYWMPLFVVLADGVRLDEELGGRIRREIRERASPRHVPDEIIAAPGIPHTVTGKKLEVPIKRILQGADPAAVTAASALDDPAKLDFFADLAKARASTGNA
jgi:acetoacetyl-CoA synthetase